MAPGVGCRVHSNTVPKSDKSAAIRKEHGLKGDCGSTGSRESSGIPTAWSQQIQPFCLDIMGKRTAEG